MSNWCSNSVVFSAAEDKLENIRNLFAEIQQQQISSDHYHLPDFVESKQYIRDIVVRDNRISFESRWSPPTSLLIEIADFYHAGFVNRFHEMTNRLYGESRYDYISLVTVSLDKDEYEAIRCDKRNTGNNLGGEIFKQEGDLLDYILEQKIEEQFRIEISNRIR
ncbi:hypothetical protein [Mucilaginibacter sp.]|uniref:DUF1281 family ferredoxin-like fold protein n=1 Tax=Mucilaginibacter sp. TaxID=1882438 RepID=UPI0025DE793B|nr:hypothetical protein [Mucilaginibacter sp.]